ncbi:MAG: hypothetical protein AAGD25_30650 [Cyanobacteria bacterium P01_F01_bin.150]
MVLSLYSQGDLVFQKHVFGKCGRVIESAEGACRVSLGGDILNFPTPDLILISVRNIPNLRLVNQKVINALAGAPDDPIGHSIMGYVGGGSVVSRAFADYIIKAPHPILIECLARLQKTRADIPHGIDQVLGLNFAFVSGE